MQLNIRSTLWVSVSCWDNLNKQELFIWRTQILLVHNVWSDGSFLWFSANLFLPAEERSLIQSKIPETDHARSHLNCSWCVRQYNDLFRIVRWNSLEPYLQRLNYRNTSLFHRNHNGLLCSHVPCLQSFHLLQQIPWGTS